MSFIHLETIPGVSVAPDVPDVPVTFAKVESL
jgi:hypothetical protein